MNLYHAATQNDISHKSQLIPQVTNKDGYMAADDDSDLDLSANMATAQAQPSQDSATNPPAADDLSAAGAAAAINNFSAAISGLNIEVFDATLSLDMSGFDNKAEEPNYFAGIKKCEDETEVRSKIKTAIDV